MAKITEICAFERHVMTIVFEQQCDGSEKEWGGKNTPSLLNTGYSGVYKELCRNVPYLEHL